MLIWDCLKSILSQVRTVKVSTYLKGWLMQNSLNCMMFQTCILFFIIPLGWTHKEELGHLDSSPPTIVHNGHFCQATKRTTPVFLTFRWGKFPGEHREDDCRSTSGLRERSGCNSGWEKGVLHWLQQQMAAQGLHAPDHGSHSRWTVTGTWKIQGHIWFSVHFTGFHTLQC